MIHVDAVKVVIMLLLNCRRCKTTSSLETYLKDASTFLDILMYIHRSTVVYNFGRLMLWTVTYDTGRIAIGVQKKKKWKKMLDEFAPILFTIKSYGAVKNETCIFFFWMYLLCPWIYFLRLYHTSCKTRRPTLTSLRNCNKRHLFISVTQFC